MFVPFCKEINFSYRNISQTNNKKIMQTAIEKLQYLCKWYIEDILNQCYNIKSEQYELAFLYPKDNMNCCGCNLSCSCTSFCNRNSQ